MVNKPLIRPAISGGGTWPGGGWLTSHKDRTHRFASSMIRKKYSPNGGGGLMVMNPMGSESVETDLKQTKEPQKHRPLDPKQKHHWSPGIGRFCQSALQGQMHRKDM